MITRFGFQAVLLTPMVWLMRGTLRMSPYVLKMTALRSGLQIMGISLMFLSLRALPLADAIAIAFVMPFIMLLLGHFVLGEEVGMRRFAACLVGFVGTLMVIQPSFSEVGWVATLPLAVALIFSLFMLVTRHIAKEADPLALQAVGGLMGLPILLLILVLPLGLRGSVDARARAGRSVAAGGDGGVRHRGAPDDDMVASLRALGHAGADAIP